MLKLMPELRVSSCLRNNFEANCSYHHFRSRIMVLKAPRNFKKSFTHIFLSPILNISTRFFFIRASFLSSYLSNIVLLYYFLHLAILESLASKIDCEQFCFCLKHKIFCDAKHAVAPFPRRVYVNNSQLGDRLYEISILNYNFTDSTLKRNDMDFLHQVGKLTISATNLRKIEKTAFGEHSRLLELDLTNNKIESIDDYTFRGLTLKILSLSKNFNIYISTRAFYDLKVKILHLDKCGLLTIEYRTVGHLITANLMHISLTDNNIEQLDRSFEIMLRRNITISLDHNPLSCRCNINWLRRYVHLLSSDLSNSKLTCTTPHKFAQRTFFSISDQEMACDSPQLTDILLTFNSLTDLRLVCLASGYPFPDIVWYRKSFDKFSDTVSLILLSSIYSSVIQENNEFFEQHQQRAEIHIQRSDADDFIQFVCLATNEAGNATLNVAIAWPLLQQPRFTPVIDSNHNIVTQYQHQIDINPDKSLLFLKNYTLIELLCAVIGTFLATLVTLLLLFWLIKYVKKRKRKQKRQWGTYESAYSGSHEYDVPRLDNNTIYHRPQIPAPLTKCEFLDFRTQQKLYGARHDR